MKALITGAGVQVGRALAACAPAGVELILATHADLDISNEEAVRATIKSAAPDLIINAAAYTAVDRAESEPTLARRVNTDGPRFLAQAARENGIRLLHISTNFVFDGTSSLPYRPDAPTAPLNVYGKTKRDGELAVLEVMGSHAAVVRTSWVYAATGRNFVRTMLRLMWEQRSVHVISDQIGTPTAAHSIAKTLWEIARRTDAWGIYHWTDSGVASWYDFAVAIAEEAASLGLIPADVVVEPITTAEYPTAALRPAYSVLDKQRLLALGIAPPVHWRKNLRKVLGELVRG